MKIRDRSYSRVPYEAVARAVGIAAAAIELVVVAALLASPLKFPLVRHFNT